jgi:glycosyltransferase involved in cell wall biosynthesis
LKIALDATYSVGENLTGVGVYSRAILTGLAASHPDTRFLFCYRAHRLLRSFQMAIPKIARRRLLARNWTPSADVFHALNQRVDLARRGGTVCTFHDLFVISGDYSTAEFRARFTQQAREAAERSDLIIAVSHFTARQVEQLLNVDRGRIRVIPHGIGQFGEPAREPAPSANREQIILFVGALQRRKNIARLVEAFEQLPRDWRLVLAGSSGFGAAEILARIENSRRRDDIQVLGYVSDAALSDLYRRAAIFAFPSLDEGFGMPILDAMSNGLAVLTSNVSAMPEVTADAALLVNPTDVSGIAGGLNKLIGDSEFRTRLIQKGLARSRGFTWERAIEKTWQVYQELLGGRSV